MTIQDETGRLQSRCGSLKHQLLIHYIYKLQAIPLSIRAINRTCASCVTTVKLIIKWYVMVYPHYFKVLSVQTHGLDTHKKTKFADRRATLRFTVWSDWPVTLSSAANNTAPSRSARPKHRPCNYVIGRVPVSSNH